MANWFSSKLKAAESLLQQIDQQAAESLGKNDNSQAETVSNIPPRKSEALSLKAQLKKENTGKNIEEFRKIDLERSRREKKASESLSTRTTHSPVSPNHTADDEDWTELLGSSKSSSLHGKTNGVSKRDIVNGDKTSQSHSLNRSDSSIGSVSKQTQIDLALLEAKKTHSRSASNSKPVRVLDARSNKVQNNVPAVTDFGKQGDGLLTSSDEVFAKMDVEFRKLTNCSPVVSDAFDSSERSSVNDNQSTLVPINFNVEGDENSSTYSVKAPTTISNIPESNALCDDDKVHKPLFEEKDKCNNQGGSSHDEELSSLRVDSDDVGIDSPITSGKSIPKKLAIKEGRKVSSDKEPDAFLKGFTDTNYQENNVNPAFKPIPVTITSKSSIEHREIQPLQKEAPVSPSTSTKKLDLMPIGSSESEDGSSSETESGSSSESEDMHTSKREKRKRREQMIAEAASARAIEAIREHESIVARLEREKQSVERIFEEREKQQAQEASMMQSNMEEVIKAVEQEKQKHNSTRMKAMARLAELEKTNAELARFLASTQWKLEKEVSQVTQLRQEVDLKELVQEDLRNKISAVQKNISSLNQLDGFSGTEFQHEILEAECVVISDKIKRLHDKEKMLEENITTTRTMLEVPTDLELELKRRLIQLTDHLIHKQAQVEALTSEKATLIFRLETLAGDQEATMQSDFAGNSRGSWLDLTDKNDLELGAWRPGNPSLHFVLHDKIESGMHHIVSIIRQLDSIFSMGVMFLRRNQTAQACTILYLVCLHVWVLYIIFSGDSVDTRSGAVVSLENINKTSGF